MLLRPFRGHRPGTRIILRPKAGGNKWMDNAGNQVPTHCHRTSIHMTINGIFPAILCRQDTWNTVYGGVSGKDDFGADIAVLSAAPGDSHPCATIKPAFSGSCDDNQSCGQDAMPCWR